MNKTKLSIACLLAVSVLAGCSKSSDEQKIIVKEDKSVAVSGKAIDGYIVGGTVFLDINGNGIADISEPQKITEEGGDYLFEVPEKDAACLAYSAIIVDVPVGAIDEGSEEEGVARHEVTDAYQIVLQPTFEPITEADFTNGLVRNISPLTTVIWQAIEQNYPREVEEKHCDYLKEHNEAVTALKTEIEDTLRGLVSYYNLSAEQMYADFIADKDSEAFHIAQDIVKGLKAAYKLKTELRAEYPEGEVRVFVSRDQEKDEYFNVEDGWYRDVVVFHDTGYFSEDVKLVSDEQLNEVDYVLTHLDRTDKAWNDQALNGELSVRKDVYRDPNGEYRCSNIERIEFKENDIRYELSNSFGSLTFDTFEECVNDSFDDPYERSFRISYDIDSTYYFGVFFFREAQSRFTELAEWIDVENKTDLDSSEMIDVLKLMPYRWDDEVSIDTSLWRKRKEEGNVQLDVENGTDWTRATTQSDGTTVYECSSDGENWTSCEG